MFGSVRGQFAGGNLDSSQKFILGGPTGIRAYPVGEAPGDEGHAVTVEARYDLPDMPERVLVQVLAFYDMGRVTLHKNPWPNSVNTITGKNRYRLSGAGAGLNVSVPGRLSVRVAYAHRLGSNDGRTVAGSNSDNRSDSGRFWVRGIVWF